MSSDFRDIARRFFRGEQFALDAETHKLTPLDESVASAFKGAGVAVGISKDDVSNTPLMNRFIEDLSHEMDRMDLSASSSRELVCETQKLAFKLLNLDEYQEHKGKLFEVEQKAAFFAKLHELNDVTIAPQAALFYQPKMSEVDAEQLFEVIKSIPQEKRQELVLCAKALTHPDHTSAEIHQLLSVLSEPEIMAHANKFTEITNVLKRQDSSISDICGILNDLKNETTFLIYESIASFIPSSCSDDGKVRIFSAFSWQGKPQFAQPVAKFIRDYFSFESDPNVIVSVLDQLNKIPSIEQFEVTEGLFKILAAPLIDQAKKNVILEVLVDASSVGKAGKIADLLRELPLDEINNDSLRIVAECFKNSTLDFSENLQFIKHVICLLKGDPSPYLLVCLQRLNRKEVLPHLENISHGIQELLKAGVPFETVITFIIDISSELGTFPFHELTLEALKLNLNARSASSIYKLYRLLASEYQFSYNLSFINMVLSYPIEGMSPEQVDFIVDALHQCPPHFRSLMINSSKDLINKDMRPDILKWVLSVMIQPSLLMRVGQIQNLAKKLLEPSSSTEDFVLLIAILNGFPLYSNLNHLSDCIETINTPKMPAKDLIKLLKLFQELPEPTWKYYAKRIEGIKTSVSSNEMLLNLANDFVPDKETLAKLAIYLSGSSVTLKTGVSIDVGTGYTSKALAAFYSLLDEVSQDLETPDVESKLQEAVKQTRQVIQESLLIDQELRKILLLDRKAQAEKAASVVIDKLAKSEPVVFPYLLSHRSPTGEYSGHFVSLEIQQQPDGLFRLAVYNTGFGINHHTQIAGTSKYFPFVVKDIPSASVSKENLTEFFESYASDSSHDLEVQFKAFYERINGLGTRDDTSGRAYNEQGQIGNCSVKCFTKLIHDKLGDDYEFIKTLMHKKLYDQLIAAAGSPASSYDITSSPRVTLFLRDLETSYGIAKKDIDDLISEDKSKRNQAFGRIKKSLLPYGDDIVSELRHVFFSVAAISMMKSEAAKHTAASTAAGGGAASASVSIQAPQSILPLMRQLIPKAGEKASDAYLLASAEFLKKEIEHTEEKVKKKKT